MVLPNIFGVGEPFLSLLFLGFNLFLKGVPTIFSVGRPLNMVGKRPWPTTTAAAAQRRAMPLAETAVAAAATQQEQQ